MLLEYSQANGDVREMSLAIDVLCLGISKINSMVPEENLTEQAGKVLWRVGTMAKRVGTMAKRVGTMAKRVGTMALLFRAL